MTHIRNEGSVMAHALEDVDDAVPVKITDLACVL